MEKSTSFSHLTLEERRFILKGITDGWSKAAMAQQIGKDKSTVGKEIKQRRLLVYRCKLRLECSNYRHCVYERQCHSSCPGYAPFKCHRRDRSPGACNGCSNWNSCRFDKYKYSPEKAQEQYEETLADAREGVNLTSKEAEAMGKIIKPLLLQGLSPYQILQIHPEPGICEKTLYNYIDSGVFQQICGLTVMDLRRKVSRKLSKKKTQKYKKRADYKHLIGRTYKEYKEYISHHPEVFVTQMDTLYNDETNGPFLQTFKFIDAGILFALLHPTKTAQSMKEGVDYLEKLLGDQFSKYVNVLLTDRGSEFSDANGIETSPDGTRRTRLFYCDPMQSGQKGSLENKHIELRYILPKGKNLHTLGLVNQEILNRVLSHLNSAPVEKLGGKSPLELAEFMYPKLYEKLVTSGIRKIEKDKIILRPYLLK